MNKEEISKSDALSTNETLDLEATAHVMSPFHKYALMSLLVLLTIVILCAGILLAMRLMQPDAAEQFEMNAGDLTEKSQLPKPELVSGKLEVVEPQTETDSLEESTTEITEELEAATSVEEEANVDSSSISVERDAAVEALNAFLTDWRDEYNNECLGDESSESCVVLFNGIEEIEANCFETSLSGPEVTSCGEEKTAAISQTLLRIWFADESQTLQESWADAASSTVDLWGVDLAKLPEGSTETVFEGDKEYANTTLEEWGWDKVTVTYVREGNTVKITSLYENDYGHTKVTNTVTLE